VGSEAENAARQTLRGKPPINLNASGIADVIDELTKIQLQAMQEGDYKKVEDVRVAIHTLRRDYREKGRLVYHETRLRSLRDKLEQAQTQLSETQQQFVLVLIPG
jgi:predicted translin family RNA/ssDNA-binding protein